MKQYNKGNKVKCQMFYSDGTPSEFSGKWAIILSVETPEHEKYFYSSDDNIIHMENRKWNKYVAKDHQYRVLIDNNEYVCNHSCFIDDNINWKIINGNVSKIMMNYL